MTDACNYCDTIPWANIRNWRQVDEEIDHRPVVDFTQLKVETCFVCRAIGQTRDIRSSNQLTYHDADTSASLYTGYLTLGFSIQRRYHYHWGYLMASHPLLVPQGRSSLTMKHWRKAFLGVGQMRKETTLDAGQKSHRMLTISLS